MNLFRTQGSKLDKQYLRICSVYRLMKAGRIQKRKAIELLEQRNVTKARQTVELWSFK